MCWRHFLDSVLLFPDLLVIWQVHTTNIYNVLWKLFYVFQYMNMHVNNIGFENIQERLLCYDTIWYLMKVPVWYRDVSSFIVIIVLWCRDQLRSWKEINQKLINSSFHTSWSVTLTMVRLILVSNESLIKHMTDLKRMKNDLVTTTGVLLSVYLLPHYIDI